MKIKLFDFIDKCTTLYESKLDLYNQVNLELINFFIQNYQYKNDCITSVFSRIKSKESVREKLFRNKFYLNYESPEEVLKNLTDIIGMTLECRFIKDENLIYQLLSDDFVLQKDGFYQNIHNPNIYLDLSMAQPQMQRNGFPIYRVDGFYLNKSRINFELQIKAMVHSFWSNIEHQVVYKNTKMVLFNSLVTKMLASIRDNLDVVDSQLEIIYNQIMGDSSTPKNIGITPESFKMVVATSINELVSERMIKSIGVATNFKQASAILSQFIYITQFLNAEDPAIKMVEYFEHLNFLKVSELDFTEEIMMDDFEHHDIFCKTLGDYWIKVMNVDYDWHVFFIMCFALQTGDSLNSFNLFVETIKNLLLPKSLFSQKFNNFSKEDLIKLIDFIKYEVALSLTQNGKLDIVHEKNLYLVMNELKHLIEDMDLRYDEFKFFKDEEKIIRDYIHRRIKAMY